MAEQSNQYVFEVHRDAHKQEISEAVAKLFKVTPVSVRTMVVHGKVKRRGRQAYKRPNWKKAVITLAEGQKIDFFQAKHS